MKTGNGRAAHSSKHNAATLLLFPCLFVALTVTVLYKTVLPVAGPYLDLANMFVSSAPQAVPQRDLFSQSVSASVFTEHAGEPAAAGTDSKGAAQETIPVSSITMPNPGDLYGRLTIEGTGIDAPVYWGDSARELNAGIGTYTGGWLPGFGRTIMLAGHRTNWLEDLGSAETGAIISIQTHYGLYTYEITGTAVHHMDDESAYDFTRTDENIIIYTCYPFNYIGAAKERYFVYGEPVSGLQVDRMS